MTAGVERQSGAAMNLADVIPLHCVFTHMLTEMGGATCIAADVVYGEIVL